MAGKYEVLSGLKKWYIVCVVCVCVYVCVCVCMCVCVSVSEIYTPGILMCRKGTVQQRVQCSRLYNRDVL
jgi:hypothetical protein